MKQKKKEESEITKYIKNFGLQELVNDMMNCLIKSKPDKPIEFMIKYLAGQMTKEEREKAQFIIPEPYPTFSDGYPKVEKTKSILKKVINKNLFKSYKIAKTNFGATIFNICELCEKDPTDKIGCSLCDEECISTFPSLLIPVLEHEHRIKINANDENHCLNNQNNSKILFQDFVNMNSNGYDIKEVKFVFSRNFAEIPFPSIMTEENSKFICESVTKEITELTKEKILPEMTKCDAKEIIAEMNYKNINDKIEKIAFCDSEKKVIILINIIDHLKIILVNSNRSIIDGCILRGENMIKLFEKNINFAYSEKYGYLTSEINLVGAGLEIYTKTSLDPALTAKELPGATIDDILNQFKFDFYSLTKESSSLTLKLNNSFKFYHKSQSDYIYEYFGNLSGIIYLSKFLLHDGQISFKKLNLPPQSQDSFVKKSYENYFTKYRYTLSSFGQNLNGIMAYYVNDQFNPFGFLLHDQSEFVSFKKFIMDYVHSSQNFDIESKDHIYKKEEVEQVEIDEKDKGKIVMFSLCLIRNIDQFPFPTSSHHKNDRTEEILLEALNKLNAKGHFGDYYSLSDPNTKDQATKIIEENMLMTFNRDDMKKFNINSDYPKHRGVMQFDKEVFAVVNDVDHMKFYLNISQQPCDDLYGHFIHFLDIANEFGKIVKFCYDLKFGFLTSCPRFLGTGLLLKMQIKLGTLEKNEIERILKDKDFAWKIVKDPDSKELLIELINKYTIGRSESEIMSNLLICVKNLLEIERGGKGFL